MILGNLTRNTTVQGDVHLSLWCNGEVAAEKYISGTDDLHNEPDLGLWKRAEISYIFSAPDGLHIEFEMEG